MIYFHYKQNERETTQQNERYIYIMEKELQELNSQLGELVGIGKDITSDECTKVLGKIKILKDKETYLLEMFGKNISIFDTFVSIEDVSFQYLFDLSNKDIFLNLFLHNGNGFYADKSEIAGGYTNQELCDKLSNFRLSFDDDYLGLRVHVEIKYKDTYLGVWFKLKDSKQLFNISGDYKEFKGGFRIVNCKLNTKDLQFTNDFKSITWGRGSNTYCNSFCKYPTKQTLKEWLELNKETLCE